MSNKSMTSYECEQKPTILRAQSEIIDGVPTVVHNSNNKNRRLTVSLSDLKLESPKQFQVSHSTRSILERMDDSQIQSAREEFEVMKEKRSSVRGRTINRVSSQNLGVIQEGKMSSIKEMNIDVGETESFNFRRKTISRLKRSLLENSMNSMDQIIEAKRVESDSYKFDDYPLFKDENDNLDQIVGRLNEEHQEFSGNCENDENRISEKSIEKVMDRQLDGDKDGISDDNATYDNNVVQRSSGNDVKSVVGGNLWSRMKNSFSKSFIPNTEQQVEPPPQSKCEPKRTVSGAKYFRRGSAKMKKYQYLEAVALYNFALMRQREELGEDHVDCGTTLNEIGMAWMMLGERYLALTAFEEALYIFQKMLGDGAEEVAKTTNNIWMILHEQRMEIEEQMKTSNPEG